MKNILKLNEILIISLVVLLLISFIFFINIPIYKYFLSIKENLLIDIKEATGFEIKYENISPNIIGKINVFEVVVYNPDGTRLELGDIEITYSIMSFFRRSENLMSFIKKIKLKTLNLRLDKDKSLAQFNNIRNIFGNNQKKKLKIKRLIIEVPKGKINIIDENKSYLFQTDNLKIVFNSDIKIDSFFNIQFLDDEKISLEARFRTKGMVTKEDDIYNTNFDFEFHNFVFGNNKLRIQRFVLESIGQDFTITRKKDALPITFDISRKNGVFFTDIDIENLDVKELFVANKKSFYVPDSLTFKSDMFFDIALKNIGGIFKLNSHHDKMLFLNNFDMDLDINIANDIVYFNRFFINNINKEKYIDLKGFFPLYPKDFDMVLTLKDFEIPKTNINTEIKLNRTGNGLKLKSDYFLINGEDIGQIDISMLDLVNKYEISSLKDFNGYTLNGEIIKRENFFVAQLDHTFSDFSISKIIKAFKEDSQDNIVLNGQISNTFSNDDFQIKKTELYITNGEKKISSFVLAMKNKILFINDLLINTNKEPYIINSWVDFKRKPILANLKLQKNDLNFNIYSRISNNGIGFSLNQRLHAGIDLENNYIYFKANRFKLPFKRSTAELNFDIALDLDNMSINQRKIYVNRVNIFKNEVGRITAKISLWNNKLYIKDFVYKDSSNYIDGDSVHEFDLNNKLFITGKGFFKDDKKEESYSLNYEIEDEKVNAKLYVTHMESEKILSQVKGNLNLRLNIYNKLINPNIDLDIDIADGYINNNPLTAFFIVKKDDKGINIKKGSFQIGQNRISIKNSLITLDEGVNNVNINGAVFLEALQKKFKTNFTLNGKIDNITKENPNIDLDLEISNITLGIMKHSKLKDIEKYEPLKINISSKENTTVIKNYGDKLLYATKNNDNIVIKFYKEDKTVFDGSFKTENGNLDGNIIFSKFPVNAIKRVLLPFIGIDEGLADGRLELKGTIKDPVFYGNLNVYYGIITLPDYLPDPIINITGIINVDESKFIVSNVNAEVKKGLVHGYGELILNGWKLERYVFHINSDMVPAHINNKAVNAKGIGYIKEFILEGRPKNFNFIGDFFIETGDITLASLMGVSKRSKIREVPINVIIDLESGKKIKVNHPIFKGIIAPGQKFRVKFIGEEAKVYLGGSVDLQKGEVNYLSKNFKIEQANFQFFEDEITVNPNVNLKAYYRTKDSRKEPIKIYLTMNNRLIPFETTFSAFPYKSQEEINGLLGLSFAYNTNENDPTEIERDIDPETNLNTLVNTTNYLSNSFIFTPVENRIRNITGLDTFSMDTKIFGNIIKSNTSNIGSTLDLLDGSSLTLGKYLFNELYFESMMSLHKNSTTQEEYFLPFDNENYGLNLQFMLQLELPFFLIGYSFLPKDYTNLLNADHQISLEANFRL